MADDFTRRRTGEAVLQRVGGAGYNAVLGPLKAAMRPGLE